MDGVSKDDKNGPWLPAEATRIINGICRSEGFKLTYSQHAKKQMQQRELLMGDILYVLKNGFVYDNADESTQAGLFKYKIESRSPSSGHRVVRLIVVVDRNRNWLKLVTVMWVDG